MALLRDWQTILASTLQREWPATSCKSKGRVLTSRRFPNTSIWVTEYNLNNQSLRDTQVFYNMSAEYLDRLPYIERYSFFGAFRSSVSNVGANATMLSVGGRLTDIGRWYLGRAGNGVDPKSTDSGSPAPGRRWAVLSSLVLAFFVMILVI